MKLCFNKLWKLLIDKNMNKMSLRKATKISAATMAKLGKGENVNTEVLLRICAVLDCDITEIMHLERSKP